MLLSTLTAVGTGVVLTSPFIVDKLLAENGILLTKTKEGTAQAVLNGEEFSHFVMAYRGFHFTGSGDDDTCWIVERDAAKDGKKHRNLNIFGWRYVGIPGAQKIYNYKMSWRELQQDEKTGKSVVVARSEMTNFVYVNRFPYVMVLDDGETRDSIPVKLQYVAVIRVTNLYRALFQNENWPQLIEAVLNEIAKDYASQKSYEELIQEATSRHKAGGFSDMILKEDVEVPDGDKTKKVSVADLVEETYGVRITNAYLYNVDPHEEYRSLTLERTTAEIRADVTRTEAKGKADATRTIAEADADAVRMNAEAINAHPHGLEIDRLRTLREIGASGNTVVVAPDLVTPGIGEYLKKDKSKSDKPKGDE